MADYFMHDVRFRGVVKSRNMSKVLGATENFEGQAVKKLSLAKDSMGRFYDESCLALKKLTKLIKLWNPF